MEGINETWSHAETSCGSRTKDRGPVRLELIGRDDSCGCYRVIRKPVVKLFFAGMPLDVMEFGTWGDAERFFYEFGVVPVEEFFTRWAGQFRLPNTAKRMESARRQDEDREAQAKRVAREMMEELMSGTDSPPRPKPLPVVCLDGKRDQMVGEMVDQEEDDDDASSLDMHLLRFAIP